jgi:ribonuclease-3
MNFLPKDISGLQESIGYYFENRDTLMTALTHSSFSNETKSHAKPAQCNERLEFLGDSVLSIIVSEYIFNRYVDLPEGDLTRMRADVVCEKALSGFARKIGLGDYLLLGHGEELNSGRNRASILADAFEALIAAVFIDAGSEGKARVSNFLLPLVIEKLEHDGQVIDCKTELQQLVQQGGGEILEYFVVDEHGPDHQKVFAVEARLNSNVIGRGEGKTKREAEQAAARQALELFGEVHNA